MADKPQLFSGARGVIEFTNSNGVVVPLAIATDININVREQLRPSYVLGEVGPLTIEPLSMDVDCSIGRLVPINTATGNKVALPEYDKEKGPVVNGVGTTAVDIGLEELISNVLIAKSVEIVVYDLYANKGEKKVVAKIKEARFTGRSMNVSVGDVAQERLNFVGIYDAGPNDQAAEGTENAGTGYGL